MDEKNRDLIENKDDKKDENIFSVNEIILEEMAIDGICGVY